MGRLYRPRAFMQLTLPGSGDDTENPVSFPVRIQSFNLTVNDHTHADELRAVFDWHDAGIDPRILSTAIGSLYVGNETDEDLWTPGEEDLRFIGRMTAAKRHGGGDRPLAVEAHFLDYTSFFIQAKPFATKGIPRLDQTVADAWVTLIGGFEDEEGLNPVGELVTSIEFRGLASPGPVIGKATAARFRKAGARVHVDPKKDAWGIWQDVVGSVGLISYWDRDLLVVTTALDLYTGDNRPVFLWGRNILTFNEERTNNFERKGVAITSFDPVTGTTIEALWPPVGDKRLNRKIAKPAAAAKGGGHGHGGGKGKAPNPAAGEHRDTFQFSGITDPDALLELAKTAYMQRSRQEFTGSITTAEMLVETEGADDNRADRAGTYDVLSLRSGDTVVIQIDEADWAGQDILDSLPSRGERILYFVERGYSGDVARLLAGNLEALVSTRAEFYVKGLAVEFSVTDEGGSFQVTINYCNKIERGGSAASTKKTDLELEF